MMSSQLYYKAILDIVGDYLGPAAGRFLDRQINSYLNKRPDDIGREDIPMLALRIRSGLVVLTHDEKIVDECFQRITSIGDSQPQESVLA